MVEEKILGYLEKSDCITDSGSFASEHCLDHNDVVNVIKSLHGFRLVEAEDIKRERYVLTDEGKLYAQAGSPEVQLLLAIPTEGIQRNDLQKNVDSSVYKIGFQQAMKSKWMKRLVYFTVQLKHSSSNSFSLLLSYSFSFIILTVPHHHQSYINTSLIINNIIIQLLSDILKCFIINRFISFDGLNLYQNLFHTSS